MRLIFLDSGPLGLIVNPRAHPRAERCRRWSREVMAAGWRVFVPEIADFEIRRKLLHLGVTAGLARLGRLKIGLEYAPIATEVMLKAAELWAESRRAGRPTAAPDALDGDCILAAQALPSGGPADEVVVATENVGHLDAMCEARLWEAIA